MRMGMIARRMPRCGIPTKMTSSLSRVADVGRVGTVGSVGSRWCTARVEVDNQQQQQQQHHQPIDKPDKVMSYWLWTCSGLVFCIVVVGGITRLTESGLSIVEWRPVTGTVPPLTEADWEAEFDKYKTSPEFAQNPNMTLATFKSIFFWEWFHRFLGRTVGAVYLLPLVYFTRTRVMSPRLKKRLLFFGFLGGLQGAIGWLMVKSGLQHQHFEDGSKATVSPYRLALHLGTAFILAMGLHTTAMRVRAGNLHLKMNPSFKPIVPYVHGTMGWVFCTAMTGAAVAGLDAGWIYCEFPYMGNSIIPPSQELFLEKCSSFPLRNLFENPTFAQFTHRCMAMSSLALVGLLSLKARNPAVLRALTATPAGKALLLVQILTVTQVTLGISTLVNATPIPMAVAHQATSLMLLMSLVTFQVLLVDTL